ncbi:MAG: acyl-CoA thioesterase [Proteobacteria bacterium]|nr:acyl-CoA thioesterase [Pseudomonadota bacterium]
MNKRPNFIARMLVRFTHTDPAGYVFFPRYFEMFQATVEDWFNSELKVNYANMFSSKYGFPTAKTECQFMKPCRLGESLDMEVVLDKIGTSSITLTFKGSVGGEERLEATSVLVAIELKYGRPIAIDNELRSRMEAYQQGVIIPSSS